MSDTNNMGEWQLCPKCNGEGYGKLDLVICPHCFGGGRVLVHTVDPWDSPLQIDEKQHEQDNHR